MTTPKEVNPDFRDLLFELNAAGVDSVIIGAHAVMMHTEPRFTKDLDVLVRASPESAPRILVALRNFGAPTGQLTPDDFSTPGITFQIGIPPNRIDICTEADGVEFSDFWATRVPSKYGDVEINVASIEPLITNKKKVGRLQDLVDVEKLERALKRGKS